MAPAHGAGPKAKSAALGAIELDETRAEGHGVLADVFAWTRFRLPWGGEREFKRGIELDPHDADSR
jgi:hypothetical protein